jgi:excisionase family DNA binding protein
VRGNVKRDSDWARKEGDALDALAAGLAEREPVWAKDERKIAMALHEMLGGGDEGSRSMRAALQRHLMEAEERLGWTGGQAGEALLTIEQAAKAMGSNRAHVAMMVDAGRLPGARVDEGGHRWVPESCARAWREGVEKARKNSDYRAAAEDGGMYDVPETAFAAKERRRRSR